VTVPVGFTRGLPVGMSIFGRAWTEATLIRIAAAVEDLLHARRPPSFPASADLAAPTDCGHDCASR
jgi:amidase